MDLNIAPSTHAMEISTSLYEIISTPASAFLDPAKYLLPERVSTQTPRPWPDLDLDGLNGQPAKKFQWRIDGGTLGGTRFFAIPLFVQPVRPLRTDVCILDPNNLPLDWRHELQTSSLCYTANPDPKHPLIQRLLCVLECWTVREKELAHNIINLPFASRIIINNLFINPCPTPEFDRNDRLEKQWLSLDSLKELWRDDVADTAYPPTLDLLDLELDQQLQDSITLVRSSTQPELGQLIFKSSTNGTHFLYHELQTLLSIPAHDNVLGPPLFIVTKKCHFGGKVGVCGFILPYYSLGSLRANIPRLRNVGLQTVLGIAIQVCSALVHLKDSRGIYCSDLRPDNVILYRDQHEEECALLIDFEQRGNWYTWSPPEIYHLEHLQGLIGSTSVPNQQKRDYKKILRNANCEPKVLTVEHKYQPRPSGANGAWNSLSLDQQESATVYMFGKLLWCLFEGVSRVSSSDVVWSTGPDPDDALEFPRFQRTPECLRAIIMDCTKGAPEHERRFSAVVRKGDVISLRSSPPPGCDLGSGVLGPSKKWWQEELKRSEEFLRKDRTSGPLFSRPRLVEVLEKLQRTRACSKPNRNK
jgi:hypothetical protein